MILIVQHQKSIKNITMDEAYSVSFRFASGQNRELCSISVIEPIQTQLHSADLESWNCSMSRTSGAGHWEVIVTLLAPLYWLRCFGWWPMDKAKQKVLVVKNARHSGQLPLIDGPELFPHAHWRHSRLVNTYAAPQWDHMFPPQEKGLGSFLSSLR